MTDTTFLLILLASVVGGAVGAMIAGEVGWKGAVAVLIGSAVNYAIAITFPAAGALLIGIAAIVAIGIVGAAMKMHGRQVVSVVIGSFLFSFVATLVIGSMTSA